jgi:O-antigen ligase
MTAQRVLAALLFAGIAVMWIPGPIPSALLQMALLTAACVSVLRNGWRGGPLIYTLLAAAAWGCLQLALGSAAYARATLEKTLDWTAWLAAAYLAARVFSFKPHALWFSNSLAIFGGIMAASALIIRYTLRTPWMGPFVYENQYAAFIELTLPPALAAAFDPARRTWAATLAAVMIGSVLVSGSIAGAGIVMVETAVVIAMLQSAAKLPWRTFGAGLAALAILVLTVGAITGWSALDADLRRTAPYQMRRTLAESTLEMAYDRPLLGVGLGTWSAVYPSYARFDDGMFDNQAHNDWLQWLAEGGAPFFALMLAMAWIIARGAWRNLYGLGLVFVLAHCLLEYHFQQRPAFGCLYFAIAGAVCTRSHHTS